jgi:hypothetical protein
LDTNKGCPYCLDITGADEILQCKWRSIAVIKDYKIEWAKGYGWADITEKRPVTVILYFRLHQTVKV